MWELTAAARRQVWRIWEQRLACGTRKQVTCAHPHARTHAPVASPALLQTVCSVPQRVWTLAAAWTLAEWTLWTLWTVAWTVDTVHTRATARVHTRSRAAAPNLALSTAAQRM
jgi:hypothetical protein